MGTVKLSFDWGNLKRKIVEAAAKQIREKLRSKGLSRVKVTVVPCGSDYKIEFSGPEEDVKKAAKLFGKQI